MSEFKIGKLQEKWLQELEQHPEQQISGQLGKRLSDSSCQYCCLGKGLEILGCLNFNSADNVVDGGHEGTLVNSYHGLGLYDCHGSIKRNIVLNGTSFISLTSMNDCGLTWPEIAAEIRKDPTNFFTESK